MGRDRQCWNVTTVICSTLIFVLGIIPKISVAEGIDSCKALPLTQNELTVLAVEDQASVETHSVSSGGDDGLAVVGAIFLGLILLCLVVGAIDKNQTSTD